MCVLSWSIHFFPNITAADGVFVGFAVEMFYPKLLVGFYVRAGRKMLNPHLPGNKGRQDTHLLMYRTVE